MMRYGGPRRATASLAVALALAVGLAAACGASGRRRASGGGGGGGGGSGGGGQGQGEGEGEAPGGDATLFGELVEATAVGVVRQARIPLPALPVDAIADNTDGPGDWGNVYGQLRAIHPVALGGGDDDDDDDGPGGQGVVWQARDGDGVYLTRIDGADAGVSVRLPQPADNAILAAATGDDAGRIYLLYLETGTGVPDDTRRGWLLRALATDGAEDGRSEPDTGPGGLDVVTFGDFGPGGARNQATMRWSGGVLCVMLARQMHRTPDGLNHQGGIGVVFDAETLERTAHLGQTSGHSFSNVLDVDGRGAFVGVDLGDNYPRGVHVHRMVPGGIASRVVYTFKTAHGTTPESPSGQTYPPYDEISGDGGTFYRWSNDNATYTELGGVVRTPGAITVAFASELPGLDNRRVGALLNDPRDLVLVQVRSDLPNATRGDGPNVVTDDLVLSAGAPAEEGGFYDFGGGWQPQRNVGAVRLTRPGGLSANASRVKLHRAAPGDDGRLLAVWERWTPNAYVDTRALVVSPAGEVLVEETVLPAEVRLGWRDDPFPLAGGVGFARGALDPTADPEPAGELVVTQIAPPM